MSAETPVKLTHNEDIKAAIPTLAGTIAATIADATTDHFSEDDNQFLKFHGSYQQDDRDLRKTGKKYIMMIRGRIPGGVMTADEKSVQKGAQLFAIYCVPCHGKSGTGDGYVGAKLILRPFDLTSADLAAKPDGHIFGMMTFGGAIMPPYAYDLSATERWNIVNYVRKGLKQVSATQAATSAK